MIIRQPVLTITALLLLTFPLSTFGSQNQTTMDGDLGIGYEIWNLPDNERMGVVEMTTRLDQGNSLYTGLSIFSAVAGDRGGFFTGGINVGLTRPVLTSMALDVGVFVGGGGGGAAPQGGGLMTRLYAGVLFKHDTWNWGLTGSRTRFPNGGIDSRQWSVMLQRPMQFNIASGWEMISGPTNVRPGGGSHVIRRLAVNNYHYFPHQGTLDTTGNPAVHPLRLLGFSMDFDGQYRDRLRHYAGLQTAGAMAGDSDGYAELLGTYSLAYSLSNSWSAQLRLGLGAGGGGQVATGGGLLGRAELGVLYSINPAWQVSLDFGYVDAPQGRFSADVLAFCMAHQYGAPVDPDIMYSGEFDIRRWRFSVINQRYRSAQRTAGSRAAGLDLIGSRIDWLVKQNVYVSGIAAAAYAGGGGGYATGQFGLGWSSPLYRQLLGSAEVFIGAGGGGGIDVGGGQLLQYQFGLEWLFDSEARYGLQATVGQVIATDGSLDSSVVGLALTWRLSSWVYELYK